MLSEYHLGAVVVIFLYSFLNFHLCSRMVDGLRFHKFSIYVVCLVNALLSPLLLHARFSAPTSFSLVVLTILVLELFLLFRGQLMGIIGVVIGTLIHLLFLRGSIIAVMSIVHRCSMYQLMTDEALFPLINLGGFAAQLVTLTLFITLVPLKTLRVVMNDKGFYKALLTISTVVYAFMTLNSYMFQVDYFTFHLAMQELIILLFSLAFFYLVMLFLVRIVALGAYKEKSEELEIQIGKEKKLNAAVLQFAEVILEANCTQNKVTRILVDSDDRPTEHTPTLDQFFSFYSQRFTHPEDVHLIENLNSTSLLADYAANRTESVIDFRSTRITSGGVQASQQSSELSYHWYRMRITLTCDEDTADIMALFTVDDIQLEKEAELALRQKAETDPLTGAFNKAAFATKVDAHLGAGGRGALFMFDLDNFKGINDNMGHSSGDKVLIEVYHKVVAIFRSDDIVGRVGGDEFVVFLTGVTEEALISRLAKRICSELNQFYHAQNGVTIEISSSVGIAHAPEDGSTFAALFDCADVAMYHSKNSGKNTFTLYRMDLHEGYSPKDEAAYTRSE